MQSVKELGAKPENCKCNLGNNPAKYLPKQHILRYAASVYFFFFYLSNVGYSVHYSWFFGYISNQALYPHIAHLIPKCLEGRNVLARDVMMPFIFRYFFVTWIPKHVLIPKMSNHELQVVSWAKCRLWWEDASQCSVLAGLKCSLHNHFTVFFCVRAIHISFLIIIVTEAALFVPRAFY